MLCHVIAVTKDFMTRCVLFNLQMSLRRPRAAKHLLTNAQWIVAQRRRPLVAAAFKDTPLVTATVSKYPSKVQQTAVSRKPLHARRQCCCESVPKLFVCRKTFCCRTRWLVGSATLCLSKSASVSCSFLVSESRCMNLFCFPLSPEIAPEVKSASKRVCFTYA